jgi:hypothetical protein
MLLKNKNAVIYGAGGSIGGAVEAKLFTRLQYAIRPRDGFRPTTNRPYIELTICQAR